MIAAHRLARLHHWDIEASRSKRRAASLAYQGKLRRLYRFLVLPGLKVLEIGCGRGDLLAALHPAVGIGVDFSEGMLRQARQRHPELTFIQADAYELALPQTFDVIILSDLVNDLWDVQTVFSRLLPLCTPGTRIILNFYSRLWQLPLNAARRLGLAQPLLPQNWLAPDDVTNLLRLAGFETVRGWPEILCPLPVPIVGRLLNRYLVKLWLLRSLALTNLIIARPAPVHVSYPAAGNERPRVSVIIPARNEAGNIPAILARVPEMGGGTELIFVEGGSSDDSYDIIRLAISEHPERKAQLFKQSGKGKGDAVRLGFAKATGDILMILDADLTVPPEDLPRFYDALVSGKGEFINGVRLVYPMEDKAMRFCNLVANKFFGVAFSWLLGQPVKDTLCGTKVMWKHDYERLVANRAYFGDFDPFGDFDLLFGAARLNLKIVDLPVRYRERTYGTTNIQRWRHGVMLLRMMLFAARRIKFV